jgi:hypothetical protein
LSSCPNASGGTCRAENDTRAWIAGTTNLNFNQDEQVITANLGFTFNYYGTNFTKIGVSSNGNAQFGGTNTAYKNVAIPDTANPDALLAIFWDDLDPTQGGGIYTNLTGTAPNRVFTIEWRDIRHYGLGNSGATFEIQLTETTNHIWFIYQDTTFGDATINNGLSATSGIENLTGSAGNQYSYNTAVLTAGKVLHFWTQ